MSRRDFITNDTGQTMTEYGVVLTLIIVVTLVAFTQLGDGIQHALEAAKALLP